MWVDVKMRIAAGYTDRLNGTSELPYTSCNLGLHVGDRDENVLANRERTAGKFGLPLDSWVAGEQVHGDRVAVVTKEMKGLGARDLASMIPGTDALITDEAGITLTTYAADCVPLLFADEVRLAIGAAHAGWQGTVLKIGAKTVRKMVETYGCDPANIRVKIGPSIGPCCYEVDEPVVSRVRDAFQSDHAGLLTPGRNGRFYFDVWRANELALLEAGIVPQHIERLDRCTSCHVDELFSHRKERGRTGRHAGLVAILVD